MSTTIHLQGSAHAGNHVIEDRPLHRRMEFFGEVYYFQTWQFNERGIATNPVYMHGPLREAGFIQGLVDEF